MWLTVVWAAKIIGFFIRIVNSFFNQVSRPGCSTRCPEQEYLRNRYLETFTNLCFACEKYLLRIYCLMGNSKRGLAQYFMRSRNNREVMPKSANADFERTLAQKYQNLFWIEYRNSLWGVLESWGVLETMWHKLILGYSTWYPHWVVLQYVIRVHTAVLYSLLKNYAYFSATGKKLLSFNIPNWTVKTMKCPAPFGGKIIRSRSSQSPYLSLVIFIHSQDSFLKVFETFADTLSAPGPPYDDQHLIRSYVTKEFGGQKLKNGTASQVGLHMLYHCMFILYIVTVQPSSIDNVCRVRHIIL